MADRNQHDPLDPTSAEEMSASRANLCPWDPGLTREEIDRRVRESKRSSLDEVLSRLEAVFRHQKPE